MKDPIPQFSHTITELKDQYPELAYLHLVESRGNDLDQLKGSNDVFRAIWEPKVLITNNGYTRDVAMKVAQQAQEEGRTELIAFGRHFIANVSETFS